MSKNRFYQRLCTLVTVSAMAMLFSACQVLPEREPVNLYQLPPSTISSTASGTIEGGLRLLTPDSSEALRGTRLLILGDGNSFQAWGGVRWTAPVPALWRDWLLDAYWRDGRFDALSTDSTVLQAERAVSGMLREFHINTVNGRQVAVIQFDAQLLDNNTRTIIASRRFESSETVSGSDAAAAVAALGAAADRLARELISWTAEASN